MEPTTGIGIMLTGAVSILLDSLNLFREGFTRGTPPQFDRRAMLLSVSFGVMLIMAGQVAFQASQSMDPMTFRIVGWYLLVAAILTCLSRDTIRGTIAFLLACDSAAALRAGYSPSWGAAFGMLQVLPFLILAAHYVGRSLRSAPEASAA